jgi:hypothetical protein
VLEFNPLDRTIGDPQTACRERHAVTAALLLNPVRHICLGLCLIRDFSPSDLTHLVTVKDLSTLDGQRPIQQWKFGKEVGLIPVEEHEHGLEKGFCAN